MCLFDRSSLLRLFEYYLLCCRADVNHDSFLERSELKSWIMLKVQEHLAEAAAENAKIFNHLDTDSDGKMPMVVFTE